MKFSIVLFAILSAAPTAVQAAPMQTCEDQASCLGFTMDQVATDACSTEGSACEFKVCIELKLGGSCTKSASDTVSHVSISCDQSAGSS
jgi:hypothetical protein